MARAAPRITSRRDAVLREMGLGPIWRLRTAVDEESPALPDDPAAIQAESAAPMAPDIAPRAPSVAAVPVAAKTVAEPVAPPRRAVQPPATASRSRSFAEDSPRPAQPASVVAMPDPARSVRIATLDWTSLEGDMRACNACVLCERRKQAVPGVGDRQASWMFVGEGPGSEEDQRGEPFVGQAGRLLDNMLAAIGLRRGENVYIANAVKCRPPHNRTPAAAEIGACRPYLERQIALVQPKVLVALGRPAALALLDNEVSIGAARGRSLDYRGIPVVVTYHPAYLLRNPQDKGKAWTDLCFARRLMAKQTERAEKS